MKYKLYSCIMVFVFINFFYMSGGYAQNTLLNEELGRLPYIKDSIQRVDKLTRIAMLYHTKIPDSTFYYGMQAKNLSERIDYKRGEAEADEVIAIYFYMHNLFPEVLKLFNQSVLPKYIKYGRPGDIAEAKMNMSNIYYSLNDSVKGKKLIDDALELGEHLKNDSILSLIYLNYYISLSDRMSDSLSRDYLNKAELIADKHNDKRTILAIDLAKAERLMNAGHRAEALHILMPALKYAEKEELYFHYLSGYNVYIECYPNQPDTILKMFNKMYALTDNDKYPRFRLDVLNIIWNNIDKLRGKIDIDYFHRITEEALRQENKNLSEFIVDYAAYSDLEKNNELLIVKNQKNNIKIWLLIGVCLFFISVAVLIDFMYTNARKYNRVQKKLNEQITAQRDALLAADRFKNELVAIVAHDFRTPMSSILHMTEMMRNSDIVSLEEQRIYMNELEHQAAQMLDDFDNILQWIRQQLSGQPLAYREINLYNIFQKVANEFKQNLKENNLTIHNNLPLELNAQTNPEAILFVNRNLLSNAIRFSPKEGKINLEAEEDGQYIKIKIKDEGIGIDENMMDKLFSVSDLIPIEKRKTGIALSISKDFITRLGGRIWIEKNCPHGSVFCYSIPKYHSYDLPSITESA